jgi:HSP20 family protein
MTNVIFRPVTQMHKPNSFKPRANQNENKLDNMVKKSPAYANIKEMDNHFLIRLAIPGFNKSSVEIQLENEILTIQGKQEISHDVKYLKKEFSPSEFNRTFTLPQDINQEDISATFEQGVLSIFIPKAEKAQPKKIEIL